MKSFIWRSCSASLFFVLLWLGISCSGNGQAKSEQTAADSVALAAEDSDAVRLALLPTIDCLPYYYAAAHGYFEKMGVSVKILPYSSQMDCDTAIIGQTGALGFTDLVRAAYHKGRKENITAITSTDGSYALVASGRLRLKDIKQLKLRTVASSRFSSDSYFAQNVFDKAGISQPDALCPQINDYYIRASMLDEDQVDAAILPEPFVSQARAGGHNVLQSFPEDVRLGCLAVRQDILKSEGFSEKLTSLLKAYNMAVDSLNAKGEKAALSCRDILEQTLKMPAAVADSLRLPTYRHASAPSPKDVETAKAFLVRNNGISRNVSLANLVDSTYCATATSLKQ